MRDGSIDVDDRERIVYADNRPRLISGTVSDATGTYQLRDMTALEWLRATGLAGKIADELDHDPEYSKLVERLRYEQRKPLSASLPAPRMPSEFAYALGAGTLAAHELRRLTPRELHTYYKHIGNRTARSSGLSPSA